MLQIQLQDSVMVVDWPTQLESYLILYSTETSPSEDVLYDRHSKQCSKIIVFSPKIMKYLQRYLSHECDALEANAGMRSMSQATCSKRGNGLSPFR